MVTMVQIPTRSTYTSMSKDQLIDALEAHDQTLQSIYQIIHLENAKMSPGEKLFWIGARNVLAQEKPNEEGLVRLPTDKVAEFIGMSESSTGRYANGVIERYDATKVPVPYTTLKGQDRTLTYVKRDDPVWQEPWSIDLPEEKERVINGNGKYCPSCRTNNLQVTTRRTKYQEVHKCDCCGYTKVTEELDDNEPLPPMQYWPTPKGLQAGEPFENASDTDGQKAFQAGEPFEFEEKALTSARAYDPVTNTEDAQVSPAVEIEKSAIIPDLPAGKMTPGYMLNGFSLEEDWLQRRRGHGQIIVSTGQLDQAAKYISKPKDYTPNIVAYLRGDLAHIYGSRPALPDGTTYLLGYDCDTPELDGQVLSWQKQLAAAGIPSIRWKRRQGRSHLEIYTASPVDRKAFYAHLISVCPGLEAVPEVFPIGSDQNAGGVDRADFGYSWPLYYRIANHVHECAAEVMFSGDQVPMLSTGIQSDRERLTWLISQAILDASSIPPLPSDELTDEATKPRGVLLDIHPPKYPSCNGDGLGKAVIAEFNDMHTWEEIAALCGGLCRDRFRSPAHKEDTPSVVIRGNYASDYGQTPSGRVETRDKFGWWCLARGINQDEELKRRIAERRVQPATTN